MTYTHSSTTATAIANTSAALDRASQALDRLEHAAEARRVRSERSLALARAAGAGPWSVTFRSLEVGRDGWPTRVVADAPSASLPLVRYRVEVELRTATATCTCVAGSFGKPCRHSGSGLLYAQEVVKAYAEAQATYAAERRAEDRASAIAPSL